MKIWKKIYFISRFLTKPCQSQSLGYFWNRSQSKMGLVSFGWVLSIKKLRGLKVSWKEIKNHLFTIFEKLVVVGGLVVQWDFNVSSAPFVSELRLCDLYLEIWSETSMSQAWQYVCWIDNNENNLNIICFWYHRLKKLWIFLLV